MTEKNLNNGASQEPNKKHSRVVANTTTNIHSERERDTSFWREVGASSAISMDDVVIARTHKHRERQRRWMREGVGERRTSSRGRVGRSGVPVLCGGVKPRKAPPPPPTRGLRVCERERDREKERQMKNDRKCEGNIPYPLHTP